MTTHDEQQPPALRPKDMALLLLASGDLLPRQRARDQQADLSGSALKSRILNELDCLTQSLSRSRQRWSRLWRCWGHLPGQRGRWR
jgi:hypothetical protein